MRLLLLYSAAVALLVGSALAYATDFHYASLDAQPRGVCVSQLVPMGAVAARLSLRQALRIHVDVVVPGIAEEQVIGAYAGSNVAPMQDPQAVRYRTVGEFPRNSMSIPQNGFATNLVDREFPVANSSFAGGPQPALRLHTRRNVPSRLVDFFPEAIFYRSLGSVPSDVAACRSAATSAVT